MYPLQRGESHIVTKILIRVDASIEIGTGHVMRCLVLAEKLRANGAIVDFVCRDHAGNLSFLIEERGFHVGHIVAPVALESIDNGLTHSRWLGTSQHCDALETIEVTQDRGPYDWVIVDHYALDFSWESALRRIGKRIFAIDDLADRKHDCDLLLDQNLDGEKKYCQLVPQGCHLLLGPKYALLRNEFAQLHSQVPLRKRPVEQILVFMGGIDATNCTSLVIDALACSFRRTLKVDIVIGMSHPAKAKIEEACKKYGYICYIQTPRMAELMLKADLAIGAGGSASWERCCLGLPSLLISLAENQIRIAKGIDKVGAGIYLGSQELVTGENIREGIEYMRNDISSFSRNAHCLVDGQGVARVVSMLMGSV